MTRSIISSIGRLVPYKDHDDWYQTTLSTPAGKIQVNVMTDDSPLEEVLALAKSVLGDTSGILRRAMGKAVEDLLLMKNEAWLDEGEAPLSETAFLERLTPCGISFYSRDLALIYLDDGDLFWGHTIEIELNDKGEFGAACITG